MASIDIEFFAAEDLGEAYDIAVEVSGKARAEGVEVAMAQKRFGAFAAIVIVAKFAEPYVKEFVLKLVGKLGEALADKLTASQVKPFTVTINGAQYKLPEEIERLRREQAPA